MTRRHYSDEEKREVLAMLEVARGEMEAGQTEGTLPLPAALPVPGQPLPGDEAGELAAELAASFGRMVQSYREWYKLTPEEARQRAAEVGEASPEYLEGVLTGPPDQVSWFDLNAVAERDPQKALVRWEEVQRAARDEVRTGDRAARALEGFDTCCWDRARFLGLRAELTEAVRPRSGVEQQLVDQLAQWQTLLWGWQETLTAYCMLAARGARRAIRHGQPYEPPRLSEDEALARAAGMVERLHRLYLRTLRALQDQRRCQAVVVRHARQVNLGQQQVNVQPG
jgi:hypothetical protein